MPQSSERALLFAAGCATGAAVCAASAIIASRRCCNDAAAPAEAPKLPGPMPKPTANAAAVSHLLGGFRPHEHEAKIKERIDKMEKSDTHRMSRMDSSTRDALRDMIREEVVSARDRR